MRIAGIFMALILAGPAGAADEQALQKGERLLGPFKEKLMGTLQQGMKEGPVTAIDICKVEAPAIPGDVSRKGVEMGRTSHRLRNPDNAPTDWQREYLQYYLHHEDRSARTRRLDDGRMAYVEPIELKPLCAACHGPRKELSDEVRATLDEHYPDDQATGFRPGDFRGLFWVTWAPSD